MVGKPEDRFSRDDAHCEMVQFLRYCYEQLMRLWLFSSSVNSSNAHAQPSSGAICLIFWSDPSSTSAKSGSGETAWMRRLA